MINKLQQAQVSYNDKLLKNYNRNKVIKAKIEQRERENIIERRKQLKRQADRNVMREDKKFHCFDTTIIKESDITHEIEEREVEFWFNNKK